MDLVLYQTVLYAACLVNFLLALLLLFNNYEYRKYDVYHRSCKLAAINFIIFAIGFFVHGYLTLRFQSPAAASALSVSYFHCGAVLFSWSHTPLMRPDYLTRRIAIRDLSILGVSLVLYWLPIFIPVLAPYSNIPFAIFFLHGLYLSYMFLNNYYQSSKNLEQCSVENNAPGWWTPETKRRVLSHHHSFIIGCGLIVLFGLGSIAITAAFPNDIWPYTLLSGVGVLVFWFIYYALSEYGGVIEIATYAMELNRLDGSRRRK